MKKSILFSLAIACFMSTSAQLKTPKPSPTATISQEVGLTDVTITYSRPGVKDRVVFGELVPYGKIWRTGANKATSITLSTDATIGGQEVKAGSYSLFTIPGKESWTIILNNETELWGTGKYSQDNDAARFTVKPESMKEKMETFTIGFSHFDNGDAMIHLKWENTRVSFPIMTAATEMVEKQIKEILVDGPSAGTYYNAARFYLDNDKDMEQALTWINAAIEKRPDAFWMIYQKARILGKLGRTKDAIATAEKSKKMASENEDGDFGYVANNEKLIAELKKK
jgi:hypothetical protein